MHAAEDPLATRVTYSYMTMAGPKEGIAELPLRRSAPESGSLEIAVHPSREDRSATVYPQPRRARRFASALAGFVAVGALIGYSGAALAGALRFEPHDVTIGKIALAAVAGLGAFATWVSHRRQTPDDTTWVTTPAVVVDTARSRDSGAGKGWYVFATYTGPDGIRRAGTAIRKGDEPEKGSEVRLQVDAADPGHVRYP